MKKKVSITVMAVLMFWASVDAQVNNVNTGHRWTFRIENISTKDGPDGQPVLDVWHRFWSDPYPNKGACEIQRQRVNLLPTARAREECLPIVAEEQSNINIQVQGQSHHEQKHSK